MAWHLREKYMEAKDAIVSYIHLVNTLKTENEELEKQMHSQVDLLMD